MESTTELIRARRSKIYDLVCVMAVAAVVILVVIPALVPLVQAFQGECRVTTVTTPVPKTLTPAKKVVK